MLNLFDSSLSLPLPTNCACVYIYIYIYIYIYFYIVRSIYLPVNFHLTRNAPLGDNAGATTGGITF